jgi:hypothetical protein
MSKTPGKFRPMTLGRSQQRFNHDDWIFELLCGGPHNNSFVAFGVMWRWNAMPAIEDLPNHSDAT